MEIGKTVNDKLNFVNYHSHIEPKKEEPKIVQIKQNKQKKSQGCVIEFEFKFEKFELNTIVKNSSILIIGKRGTGKTSMVYHLMKNLHETQNFDYFVVFSPTEIMNKQYEKIITPTNIFYEYDSDIIQNILDIQTQNLKENKKKNFCVILDDCLSSNGILANDKALKELLFNGRHYNITYILTMQFPLEIKQELRSGFDYVFLLEDDAISNQKRIFEYYTGFFKNFDEFRQVFINLTTNYSSMVITQRGILKKINDKIKFYKNENLLIDKIYSEEFYFEKNKKEKQKKEQKKEQENKNNIIDIMNDILEQNNKILKMNEIIIENMNKLLK
jgi:hypothetical protein